MTTPVLEETLRCLCADLAAAGLPVSCCVEGGRVWVHPEVPVDVLGEVRMLAPFLRALTVPVGWRP